MTEAAVSTFPCPRCGNLLTYGQLVCPNCGGLVYARQLAEMSAAAQQLEFESPIRAAMLWREMLAMIPPDSEQYRIVVSRIGTLTSGLGAAPASDERYAPAAAPAVRPPDPLGVALLKTGGSMVLSILVYAMMFARSQGWSHGLQFATGFVVLILIHELGHVAAMRWFGLSASPPIFIPFLGALINLRQSPRNALEEAIVGIGGPVTGTLAAGATYLIYLRTGSPLMLELAYFGFLLNLFNMLPVPPLDGGRVTAAVSPWIWISGLAVAVLWVLYDFFVNHYLNFILILLLVMAWPRVKRTLLERSRGGGYYAIGTGARWAMGIAYAVLGATLVVMYGVCQLQAALG